MGGNPPKPELYCPETVLFGLPEQTTQQRDQGRANQGDTTAGHQLLHALRLCLCVIKK